MDKIIFARIEGRIYGLKGDPCPCTVLINGTPAKGVLCYTKNAKGSLPNFTFEVSDPEHQLHDTKFSGTYNYDENIGIAEIRTEV